MPQQIIAVILAVPFTASALLMLIAPRAWYDRLPGVAETGPFNSHFVRDLGCAFLICAAVLLLFTFTRVRLTSALIAVAVFISLHALVHLGELFAMGSHELGYALLRDLPTVYLPAILTAWLAASSYRQNRSSVAPRHDCRSGG
jgi:hypothetical protein